LNEFKLNDHLINKSSIYFVFFNNNEIMQNLNELFEPELLKELMNCHLVDLKANDLVLREGVFIREIPILVEGSLKVRRTDASGKEIVLYYIQPGESCILSITSCLNDKQSSAEALSVGQSKLLIVKAEQAKEWMDTYKSWRRFVMKLYHQRIDEVLTLVDHIAFKQMDFRLIEKLKEKTTISGPIIEITHQQLANELGTAREVVSRLLKHLEKQGMVSLERGFIKVLGPL